MEETVYKIMIPSEHVIRILDNIKEIIITKKPKTLMFYGVGLQMQPILQKYSLIVEKFSVFFQELQQKNINTFIAMTQTIENLKYQNSQQLIKNSRLKIELNEYRSSLRQSANKSNISAIFLQQDSQVSFEDLMRLEDELQEKCKELKQQRQNNSKLHNQNQNLINKLSKIATNANKQLPIKQQLINQSTYSIKIKQFEFPEIMCSYEQTLSDSAGLLSNEKDKLKFLKLSLQKLLLFCQTYDDNYYRQKVLQKVQQIKKNGEFIFESIITFVQAQISLLKQGSALKQLLYKISKPLKDICDNCTNIQSSSYRSCQDQLIERLQLVCSDHQGQPFYNLSINKIDHQDKDQTTMQFSDYSSIIDQKAPFFSNILQDPDFLIKT